jgi:hypothetical protein
MGNVDKVIYMLDSPCNSVDFNPNNEKILVAGYNNGLITLLEHKTGLTLNLSASPLGADPIIKVKYASDVLVV